MEFLGLSSRNEGAGIRRLARPLLVLMVVSGISACSTAHRGSSGARPTVMQAKEYAPPGSPEDPWGPYVKAASRRFAIPEMWIRQVMLQESGGQQYLDGALVTSSAGAMGLMQIMPATYEELRGRYALGPDPYHPRDNILAGAAYIRELYDRYGSPGFLAAYNAGPGRLDDHLSRGMPLPYETVNYIAAVAPRLGGSGTSPSSAIASETSADFLNRQALSRILATENPPEAQPDPQTEMLNRHELAVIRRYAPPLP